MGITVSNTFTEPQQGSRSNIRGSSKKTANCGFAYVHLEFTAGPTIVGITVSHTFMGIAAGHTVVGVARRQVNCGFCIHTPHIPWLSRPLSEFTICYSTNLSTRPQQAAQVALFPGLHAQLLSLALIVLQETKAGRGGLGTGLQHRSTHSHVYKSTRAFTIIIRCKVAYHLDSARAYFLKFTCTVRKLEDVYMLRPDFEPLTRLLTVQSDYKMVGALVNRLGARRVRKRVNKRAIDADTQANRLIT